MLLHHTVEPGNLILIQSPKPGIRRDASEMRRRLIIDADIIDEVNQAVIDDHLIMEILLPISLHGRVLRNHLARHTDSPEHQRDRKPLDIGLAQLPERVRRRRGARIGRRSICLSAAERRHQHSHTDSDQVRSSDVSYTIRKGISKAGREYRSAGRHRRTRDQRRHPCRDRAGLILRRYRYDISGLRNSRQDIRGHHAIDRPRQGRPVDRDQLIEILGYRSARHMIHHDLPVHLDLERIRNDDECNATQHTDRTPLSGLDTWFRANSMLSRRQEQPHGETSRPRHKRQGAG